MVATIQHTDPVIVLLTIDGETLETTADHPFYTEDGEWVDAADLEPGDDIRTLDGDTGEVDAVLFLERTQPMYNLTVAEAHAFFVGDGQWLVHNTEKICLKPYKDGGGHHVHSKKAFEDLPKKTYDPALAPSVPKSALKSGQHAKMTGIQQKLFRQLSKDVSKGIKKNTLKEHSRIAYETLVQAGFDPKVAKRLVRESETWLRKRGAKPTKIPWGS